MRGPGGGGTWAARAGGGCLRWVQEGCVAGLWLLLCSSLVPPLLLCSSLVPPLPSPSHAPPDTLCVWFLPGHPPQVRDLEAALLKMWAIHTQGAGPRTFEV